MIKVTAQSKSTAEILIYDVIGNDFWGEGVTGARVKKELDELGDGITDILVRINSPGGNVWDGLTIYNLLKEHDAEIHVQVEGIAASAASFIAMSGDLITMAEGTMMMIHNPWILAMGDGDQLRKAADMIDKVEAQLVDIYARRTSIERDEIDRMMAAETWMTDEEAVELGFADERTATAAEPAEEPDDVSDRWSKMIALFKHPPESLLRRERPHLPAAAAAAISPSLSAPADATQETDMTTGTASVQATDIENARNEGAQAERQREKKRRDDIRNSFGRFATAHGELMNTCLDDPDCSAEAARERLLAKLGEGVAPVAGAEVVTGEDARQKFVAGAVKAVLARAGVEKRETGNEYNGMPLWMLAGRAIELAGGSVRGMSPDQIARKVLNIHTTSDFPELLGNAAGRLLRTAYTEFEGTWQLWAGTRDVPDFKQVHNIQIGAFDALEEKVEGGEYRQGTFSEIAEPNRAKTKGRILLMTREMIVNDDLGGFNRRASMLGAAAGRTIERDVYTVLNNNPTLSDGVALFHADHANLASSGAPPNTTTLGAAKAAMRKQKGPGDKGEFLDIRGRYLLVPVALEDISKEVVTSTTKITAAGQANPSVPNVMRNQFEVVSSPYLDNGSVTAWYIAANAMQTELVQVVFLDGQREPFTDEDVDFDTDALLFKVRLDFGVAPVDYRAGFKNAGA